MPLEALRRQQESYTDATHIIRQLQEAICPGSQFVEVESPSTGIGSFSSASPELSIAQLRAQDDIHPEFASISVEV
jgi:hypothetical protein